MDFNGIILCGGQSRRMGTDKAFLPLGGNSFLDRIITLMQPLCSTIIISGDDPRYRDFGTKVVEDQIPDSGALGGLYSALTESDTNWNLVLSCDVPLVDNEIITALKIQVHQQQKVIHAITEQDAHPLIGFYHKSCAANFKSAIERGSLKLQPAVNKCDPLKVLFKDEQAEKLQNVNTPQEYQNLLNLYG